MTNIANWKQAQSDISFPQAGSQGVSSAAIVTGAKSGEPMKFPWQDVRFALGMGSIDNPGFFDHFLGNEGLTTIPAPWRAVLASTGTIAVVAGGTDGVLRETTAATLNDSVIAALGVNWKPEDGYLYFEAEVNMPAIVTRVHEIGLGNAMTQTGGLNFSGHLASLPVAVATDAIVFAFDTALGGANWVVSSVKASGTPQGVDTGVPVAASTAYVLSMLIDNDGNAYCWIDGALVATITNAITPTTNKTPWISTKAKAGTATVLNINYAGIVAQA